MNKIAFIPARGSSKFIPLKNVKEFCGRPLIFWVLKALEITDCIDKIIVATDNDKIKDAVHKFGFNKTILYDRDANNAQDESQTEDVMLEFIEKSSLNDEDIFFLVQATNPLTTNEDFENAYEYYRQTKADSLLTCVRTKRLYWTNDCSPINYNYKNRPMRHNFKGIYLENGAFYINKVKNIKKYKNRLSGKIVIYEMPEYTSTELDHPDDWIIAEQLMYKYRLIKKTNGINKIKIFFTDVDGTLTDGSIYYSKNGEELCKFNRRDGMGLGLLKKAGIKTGIITSENNKIITRRAEKLNIDYLFLGKSEYDKLKEIKKVCLKEHISLNEVAYIGDDLNCKCVLAKVGLAACPSDAAEEIIKMSNVMVLKNPGGSGAIREFADLILKNL